MAYEEEAGDRAVGFERRDVGVESALIGGRLDLDAGALAREWLLDQQVDILHASAQAR